MSLITWYPTCYDESQAKCYIRLSFCIVFWFRAVEMSLYNLLFVVWPQFTHSESRKWCQQPTNVLFGTCGATSYTSFRNSGKDIFSIPYAILSLSDHTNLIRLLSHFDRPDSSCHLASHRHDRLLLAPRMSLHRSELCQQNRINPYRPPGALYQPGANLTPPLTRYPSPANAVTCRIFTTGKTNIRTEMLAALKTSQVSPFQRESYS